MDFLDRLFGLIEELLNELARRAVSVLLFVAFMALFIYFYNPSVQATMQGWFASFRLK